MRTYGCIRDSNDARDHKYSAPYRAPIALPTNVDLRPHMPPVYDQSTLGSCTANAVAGALQFERLKKGLPDFTPSRLFLYWNTRAMEGTSDYDSGAMLRDTIKSLGDMGDLPESDWPYDIYQFATKPPLRCYDVATLYSQVTYKRIDQDLDLMRQALAGGDPFVFGFMVFESFESGEVAQDGLVCLPEPREKPLGGHAVLAVGYDDGPQHFIVRNSWGPTWGQNGYFTIPYSYLTDQMLASDFWTLSVTP